MKQTSWLSKRVGAIREDGARAWPDETITGRAYTRPANTLDLTAAAFIVYDAFPAEGVDGLIEQARKALAKDKLVDAGKDVNKDAYREGTDSDA